MPPGNVELCAHRRGLARRNLIYNVASAPWRRGHRASILSTVTAGEDLLLLAVGPRDGRIRIAERLGPALRSLELVELAAFKRITAAHGEIELSDPTPTGHQCLDAAMASLRLECRAPGFDMWLRDRTPGPPIVDQYLSLLADQGAIRIEDGGGGEATLRIRMLVLGRDRCVHARTRINHAVYGKRDGAALDEALARVVHACDLDRYLYRGLRARATRKRMATSFDVSKYADSAVADCAASDASSKASPDLAMLTAELTTLMRRQYRINLTQQLLGHHSDGHHHHHHSSSPRLHAGHADIGGGHRFHMD